MAVTWSCKLCMQKNSLDSDQCITCGRSADWKPSGEMEVYRRRDTPTAGALARPRADDLPRWQTSQGSHAIVSALSVLLRIFMTLMCPVRFLRMDEQLRVQHLTTVTVINGPGLVWINPFKTYSIVKAITLGVLDYVRVRDTMDGSERAVHGPRLFFLGPYEKLEGVGQGVSLTSMQYVLIEDQRGPLVWIPGPREEGKVLSGVRLNSTEYVSVEDTLTGARRVEKGPCIWFPGPYEEWEQGSGVWLSSTEYVTVQNTFSGERRVDKGPCVWFPGPYDQWTKGTSTSLTCTQYITVVNKLTGKSDMVKGPCIWFPGPYDNVSAVKDAIVLQDDEYVKLKDISTGTRWVHRGRSLLFLEPTWRIESSGGSGIQKSWALRGREFLRLQVAPHLRVTKG